jgi:hypothetical protein
MFSARPLRRRPLARAASGFTSRPRSLRLEQLEDRQLFTLSGDTLFPADNPWNQRITGAPVAANSSTLVSSIGATSNLHPDFGTIYEGAYIGIPYVVVSGTQPKVNVIIDAYPDESDIVPVPIPPGAPLEGDPLPSEVNDGDRHLIIYDPDNNIAYELYNVHRPSETGDGQWHADSQAVWHMDQNWFRTPGDTSADAAGLPILPGLVRVDEVLDQGVINHALRFTVPDSRNAYVYPASHHAGVSNVNYPRMGERFRLKANFDLSGFSPTNRIILQALKDYGMIVADNGSGWYLSGAPSSRWDDDELSELSNIVGSNFEAVNLTPITTSLNQTVGSTSGGTAVTITGKNFSGAAGQLQVRFGTTPASSVNIVSDTTLIVTAPAHSAGTVDVLVQTPYGTSATSAAVRFTYQAGSSPAQVVGRRLFYNQSGTAGPLRYDGNNAAINANDDLAIATDKVAYLPGAGAATFANTSSYSKGVNGVMIDLSGPHGTITAADFVFKIGNSNTPSSWATALAPISLSVRAGAGVSGSDRVTLVWANGAIKNTWLQVTVKSSAQTNLPQKAGYPAGVADVFYFGSAVGDSGQGNTSTSATVSATDELAARNNPAALAANIPITNLFDYNRDGRVDTSDALIPRNNSTSVGNVVRYVSVASPPAAPEFVVGPDEGILASSLTMPKADSDSEPLLRVLTLPDTPAESARIVELAIVGLYQHPGQDAGTRLLRKADRVVAVSRLAGDAGFDPWEDLV